MFTNFTTIEESEYQFDSPTLVRPNFERKLLADTPIDAALKSTKRPPVEMARISEALKICGCTLTTVPL